MKSIRKRLTYANVMSSIAVFLVLGGGAAYAAKKIGSHQLKANSVTTAKIKKNAVTRVKIKKNAINSSKVADGSLTGSDINASTTPFSQVVARIRGNQGVFGGTYLFDNPTYTQNAGEDNQFVGAVDVTFDAGCEAPRSATAYLLLDAATPGVPKSINDLIGLASIEDEGTGTVTRRMEFAPFPGIGALSRFAPASATQHTFSILLPAASCNSGSGATVAGAGVDVIGTK